MIRPALLATMVIAITHAARSFHPGDGAVNGSGSLLAAGFLLLAALHVGHVFEGLKLPHLTGFLLCGLATGPQGLHIVSHSMLDDLGLIKNVSIGLIALLAGSALDIRALAPRMRAIGLTTTFATMGGFFAILLALFASLFLVNATSNLPWSERGLIALLGAITLAAASPPVVIGILSEARAKGPLSELWIPLVVLNNLAVVIAFSLLSPQVAARFPDGTATAASASLAWQILGSLALGVVVGAVLALYAARVKAALGLFVFFTLFVVAEAGKPLGLDPMLVGLAAGLLLENVSQQSGVDVARAAAAASLPTFAVFFAVIGAEVHLDVFARVAPFAIAIAGARFVGMASGTVVAARLAGLPDEQGRLLPFGMIPQAGVALALATSVGSYAGWGEAVGAMLVGTVVVNELLGPVLFRAVVVRSGEAGQRDADLDIPMAEVEWVDDGETSEIQPVPSPS